LGQGGFNNVYEVEKVILLFQDNLSDEHSIVSFRSLLEQHGARMKNFSEENSVQGTRSTYSCSRAADGDSSTVLDWEEKYMYNQLHDREYISKRSHVKDRRRYALKMLKPSVLGDKDKYCRAVIDLAIEARFLIAVNHPHIIKMRAMSMEDPFKYGFFIVMDKLSCTLSDKISYEWTIHEEKKSASKIKGLLHMKKSSSSKKASSLYERLRAAFQLSSALTYLHSLNVIYRDLKPDNVGFDVDNNVKLFDFGLSKELHAEDLRPDGTYRNMTACTGTLRYMAPEVARKEPYHQSADVYSFGILLWEICTLEIPFDGYDPRMYLEQVVQGAERPRIPSKDVSPRVASIMRHCWSRELNSRLLMFAVTEGLRLSCDEIQLPHSKEISSLSSSPNNHPATQGVPQKREDFGWNSLRLKSSSRRRLG